MGGQSCNSWFDVYFLNPSDETSYNIDQANESYQRVSKIIEYEKQLVNND